MKTYFCCTSLHGGLFPKLTHYVALNGAAPCYQWVLEGQKKMQQWHKVMQHQGMISAGGLQGSAAAGQRLLANRARSQSIHCGLKAWPDVKYSSSHEGHTSPSIHIKQVLLQENWSFASFRHKYHIMNFVPFILFSSRRNVLAKRYQVLFQENWWDNQVSQDSLDAGFYSHSDPHSYDWSSLFD